MPEYEMKYVRTMFFEDLMVKKIDYKTFNIENETKVLIYRARLPLITLYEKFNPMTLDGELTWETYKTFRQEVIA